MEAKAEAQKKEVVFFTPIKKDWSEERKVRQQETNDLWAAQYQNNQIQLCLSNRRVLLEDMKRFRRERDILIAKHPNMKARVGKLH